MLGKIMKHEFKATWKYFLLIDFVTLVIGVFAAIVTYGISGDISDLPETLYALLLLCLVGYIFSLFAAALLTTLYNVYRYYRSLYSSEGYLTFTLPASTIEIVSAKMLVAFIWQFLMTVCISLSVLLFFGGFFIYGTIHGSIDIQNFMHDLWDTVAGIFGFAGITTSVSYILNMFLQLITRMLTFFFAITLGQLWNKHKILGSVIAYFACTIVMGIFSFIVNIFTGSFSMIFSYDYDPSKYFTRATLSGLFISIVVSVIMYVGCIVITDKKLNLD